MRPPFYCLAASKSIKSYALPNQEAATVSEVLVRELVSLFRDSSWAAFLSRKKFRIAFVLHYPFSFIPLSIIIIIITLLLYSSSCTRSSSFSVPPSPAATATPRAAPRPALAGREFPANFNEHLLVHGRPVLPRGLCLLPNKRADNAHCVLFKCAPLAIYLWEVVGGGGSSGRCRDLFIHGPEEESMAARRPQRRWIMPRGSPRVVHQVAILVRFAPALANRVQHDAISLLLALLSGVMSGCPENIKRSALFYNKSACRKIWKLKPCFQLVRV